MRLYLRNKQTGEIRDVEADSDEFRSIVKEVTPGGLPRWEQTSFPHADAIKNRAAYGELQDEDLGEEHQADLRYAAIQLDSQGVHPEENPHLALTPAEIEMGLTPRQKLSDLQAMYDESRGVRRRAEILDNAADHIADERRERPSAQAARGQSARAGGSDERFDPQGEDEEDDGDSDDSSASARTSSASPRQPTGAGAGTGSSGSGSTSGSASTTGGGATS